MKKNFKLIHEIILGICIVILILAALIALGTKFNIPGGFSVYSVLTGSMESAVSTGALIITKNPVSTENIHKGDIITFVEPGYQNKFVTHRVFNIIDQGPFKFFITKGDANSSPDPWRIAYGSIKGVYQIEFPYLGYFLEFLKSPIGISVFVLIPALLIVITEIKNIFSILFQMKLEKDKLRAQFKNNQGQNNYLLILPLLFLLSLLFLGTTQTYALFNSNTAKIESNSITTAKINPSSPPGDCDRDHDHNRDHNHNHDHDRDSKDRKESKECPSPTPSHSPRPSDNDKDISGDGADLTNKDNEKSKRETEIDQSNLNLVKTAIDTNSNTGGDTLSGNTASASANTASSSATVNVQVDGSSKSD